VQVRAAGTRARAASARRAWRLRRSSDIRIPSIRRIAADEPGGSRLVPCETAIDIAVVQRKKAVMEVPDGG